MADHDSSDDCTIMKGTEGTGKKRILRSSSSSAKKVKLETDQKPSKSKKGKASTSGNARPLICELTVEKEFLLNHKLDKVVEVMEFQGWGHLFQEDVKVNENEVREFYKFFTVTERAGLQMVSFVFNDEIYSFSAKVLGNILNVPVEGNCEYTKGTWPSHIAKSDVVRRVGGDPENNENQGNALKLNILSRTLHKLCYSNLFPRLQKHAKIYFQDYLVLDRILQKEAISLPKLMITHMQYAVNSPGHGLPYPGTVKKVLQHFGLYEGKSETVMSIPLTLEGYEKIGWKFTDAKGWSNEKGYMDVKADGIQETEVPVSTLNQDVSVHEMLAKMNERMSTMETKLDKLVDIQREVRDSKGEDIFTMLKTQTSLIEKLSPLINSVDETAGMGITHTMQVKDQIIELNTQLKFICTRVLDQLRTLFEDTITPESSRSRSRRR